MTDPIPAGDAPVKVELEEGQTFFWCACGRSAKQPYCDGSHKDTGLTPQKCVSDKTGAAFLCTCKQTANGPYCDGSHKTLAET